MFSLVEKIFMEVFGFAFFAAVVLRVEKIVNFIKFFIHYTVLCSYYSLSLDILLGTDDFLKFLIAKAYHSQDYYLCIVIF